MKIWRITMIERIEHEEAQKAVIGTDYNWTDLLDFQSLKDIKKALEFRHATEEECRRAFCGYFKDLIDDLTWYDEQEKEREIK